MFEHRLISGGSNEKQFKEVVAEVTPVEFALNIKMSW